MANVNQYTSLVGLREMSDKKYVIVVTEYGRQLWGGVGYVGHTIIIEANTLEGLKTGWKEFQPQGDYDYVMIGKLNDFRPTMMYKKKLVIGYGNRPETKHVESRLYEAYRLR